VSPKARFVCLSVLFSAALYALLLWLRMSWSVLSWLVWLGYTPAVIAVMLAAQGASWKRKLLFAGLTVGLSTGLFAVATLSGLAQAASSYATSGAELPTNAQLASIAARQVIIAGVPLAALALFVGRRPSVLWTAPYGAGKCAEESCEAG